MACGIDLSSSSSSINTCLSIDSSLDDLCKLLPIQQVLSIESSQTVASVCQLLHERGLRNCVVDFPSGSHYFFHLEDICCFFLDALSTDSCAARVLAVLANSPIGNAVRPEKSKFIKSSTPLISIVDLLRHERHQRVLLTDDDGQVLRVFSCTDLLELLLRCGRDSFQALRKPVHTVLGVGQENISQTVSVGESVMKCFERLRQHSLRGVAVVDDSMHSNQSMVVRGRGIISMADIRYFFLKNVDDPISLVSENVHEFLLRQKQNSVSPRGGGITRTSLTCAPFVYATSDHDLESLVSRLLSSRLEAIALCTLSTGEVHGVVSAHDVVCALHSSFQSVTFGPGKIGSKESPRSWPLPLDRLPGACQTHSCAEEAARETATGSDDKSTGEIGNLALANSRFRSVSWADAEPLRLLANIVEYEASEPMKSPTGQMVLALEDASAESLLEGDISRLPARITENSTSSRNTDNSESGSRAQSPPQPILPLALMDSLQAMTIHATSQWRQLDQGCSGSVSCPQQPSGHQPPGSITCRPPVNTSIEQLQVVLYQQRELVLYDRGQNRAYARSLSEDQAAALSVNQSSFCPLCRQPLNSAWAFVCEGYFDVLSSMSAANISAASPFASNEEAAAACGLHSIPVGLLNCGYYAHFFKEERRLGSGSFGAVYLCRHVMDEIELGVFAVKKLALGDDAKRLRQVIREVKALERLRHMNIIDYKHSWLEVSRHNELCPYIPFLFILMEYCNAGSLEDLIWPRGFIRGAKDNVSRSARLAEKLIWVLFLDVCRGLHHLHNRGILHRDLKPSNILLHVDEIVEGQGQAPVPRAMLSDFGTCEILGEGHSHVQGGYAVEFVAPECLRGEDSDEPADMWSAGLVLYAMCYGDLPYHSEDPTLCREQVMAHVSLDEPHFFRDQMLWRLVSALTAKEPVARPSAGEAERASWLEVARMEGHSQDLSTGGAETSAPVLPSSHALPLEWKPNEAAPYSDMVEAKDVTSVAVEQRFESREVESSRRSKTCNLI